MPEEMLRAERDENAARLDLRPSEMAALGMRLEKIEKRKDAERLPEVRRKAGLKRQGQLDGESPSSSKGPVRDRVGSVLGVSGSVYEKAKQVVEAAERDPEVYGDLVETMDDTGNVGGTHREMKERKAGKAPTQKRPRASSVAHHVKRISKLAAGYAPAIEEKERVESLWLGIWRHCHRFWRNRDLVADQRA
jgi:ParB family chromosome partitioning protein